MSERVECLFCHRAVNKSGIGNEFQFQCPNCSFYRINHAAYLIMLNIDNIYFQHSYLISGHIRELSEKGMPFTDIITPDKLEFLLHDSIVPKTIMGRIDKLLVYLYRHTDRLYGDVIVDLKCPAIGYARDIDELIVMFNTLKMLKYVQEGQGPTLDTINYRLTTEGLMKAESVHEEINLKQCFIAMWFDDTFRAEFEPSAKLAIRDAGYEPLAIDYIEHNDKICDQIIAEIRKSRFLVVDFTGGRQGVYYEAGFAHGLGLPVIFTRKEKDKVPLHFDIRQYNCIMWKDAEDLRTRLKDRIEATILKT